MIVGMLIGKPVPSGPFHLGWWVWTSFGSGATAAAMVLFGLGGSGLFPWFCRRRMLQGIFPDLDGTWRGTLESNWPQISAHLPGATPATALQPVAATLRVKARLLSISVTLETDTRYSDSETVLVGIGKNNGDVPFLTYVYQNRTPNPQPSDTGFHYGAARLELRDEDGVPTLRGPYWTNRNWEKGLNTAGAAVFRKLPPS
jgi:hypothetical protein